MQGQHYPQQPRYQPGQHYPQQPPPAYPQSQSPYPYQQPQPQYPQRPPLVPQPPKKRRIPPWVWIAVGIFVLGGIIGAFNQNTSTATTPSTSQDAPSSSQAAQAPTATPQPSLAYQLASINAGGGSVDANDPTIAQFQKLLDTLHRKTGDSEQQIADETVQGQQILQNKGMTIKLLDLMEAANNGIPENSHIHYAEALAALMTLMENKQ